MKLKQSMLALTLGACIVSHAQAGFYVNDDAPVITAAHPEAARKDKTVYVSFTGSRLQGDSRAELEAVANTSPAVDSVVVTTFARTAKQLALAHRRVSTVKAVLVRRGVSMDRITANAQLDPHADALDMDVQVTFRFSTQRPTLEAIRNSRFIQAMPVQSAQAPAYAYGASAAPGTLPLAVPSGAVPQQQGQTAATLEFVKKIMAMASSKLISQESAVKLVNEYLANTATAPAQSAPGNVAQGNAPLAQIVPFGEVPRVWTLSANKSLRDNIREWAITAGYAELEWNASNVYQVTYTSTVTGTFVDVLKQVANTVPSLDFRVSRNARRIEVVDHI